MTARELCLSFIYLLYKENARYVILWKETLLPPALTMLLYYAIFGTLIGDRIGEMGGYDYVQFIAPGLVMLAVITGSYENAVASFFFEKFIKSVEEMLISPTPLLIILLSTILSSCMRGILVGVIVLLLSSFFTELHIHHLGTVIWVMILTSLLFACLGMINALYADNFDHITVIPNFVLTPFTYLGGIFYSIDLLPPFWQTVSLFNPILYMINALRYGILGISDISLLISFVMVFFTFIALFSVCWYLLAKGVGIKT